MAAIVMVHEQAGVTLLENASDTFATKVTATGFLTNRDYMLICLSRIGGQSFNTEGYGFRLVQGAGDTLLVGSDQDYEADKANSLQLEHYGFFSKITQGGSADDIKFQQRRRGGGSSSRSRFCTIVGVPLDDVTEDVDWFYLEDATGADHTTTPVTRATKTITMQAGDTWLIGGTARILVNDIARNFLMHLQYEGADALLPHSREGEDVTEEMVCTQFWVEEGVTAGSRTVRVQTNDDGSGTAHRYESSAVFGLRLNAFEDFSVVKGTTPINGSGTIQELATATHTPTRTGSTFVMGQTVFDANNGSREEELQLTVDGTVVPTNYTDLTWTASGPAIDDQLTDGIMFVQSVPDTGDVLDLDAHVDSTGGTPQHVDTWIMAFSAELAPVAAAVYPPFPRPHRRAVRM